IRFQTGKGTVLNVLLWLPLFLLLFTFGCGKSEPEEPENSNDSQVTTTSVDSDNLTSSQAGDVVSPETDSGTEIVVKLLDPGAQPRTTLRYKFQAGRSETMVMVMNTSMAMEIGGQKRPETKIPSTQMAMTIESKEVSPQGDMRYEFKMEKADVLAEPGANPMMVNAMKQPLSSLVGMSGWATVTPRGFTTDADIRMPPGIDPQMGQAMDNTKQSMKQMSAPLPVEPVGRGARWQVTMPLETNGMKITQTATYELLEVQGDKVKFDVEIKQSAEPQEMKMPGAAPGAKMLLESLTSSGKGTMELQMTDLVPTSNVNMTTTNVVSANNQKIKTTMKIGMNVHPGN
ncbi:MAG: hypothetical protein JSW47_09970, partial [Phycisphaerales bacterium]